VENLTPTGIRSSDLPARSETLYRLSYPGPQLPPSISNTGCVSLRMRASRAMQEGRNVLRLYESRVLVK